jgi:large subunit ribosomal protein L4
MKIEVLNQSGEKVKDLQLSNIFDVQLSPEALALYVNYLRNSLRGAVANSKDRSEVSGGGKKPYKQKGTGRARQGSSRSPIWVGGGVTFGPTNDRNFKTKINKSQKRNVIMGIFGEAFRQNKAVVVDTLALKTPKTKEAVSILNSVKVEGKISVILNDTDTNADMSFRNLDGVSMMISNRLNVIDLISADKMVFSIDSLNKLEEIFSKK